MLEVVCDFCGGTESLDVDANGKTILLPGDWISIVTNESGSFESKQFHNRELGDCYDLWLLSETY